MIVIPAIDLKNGKCVRLRQGRDEETTEYSGDPVAVAETWVSAGAQRVHIVNLDGAFGRESSHLRLLAEIAVRCPVVLHFGGGLRTPADVDAAIDAGAGKVVLGTAAILDPSLVDDVLERYGPARLIVAVDAVEGSVVVRGWREVSGEKILAATARMQARGVEEILYTDVGRDGMMTGPDVAGVEALASTGLRVIASGGVGSLDHIRALAGSPHAGILGVIVGKALYERRFTFAEAMGAASRIAHQ